MSLHKCVSLSMINVLDQVDDTRGESYLWSMLMGYRKSQPCLHRYRSFLSHSKQFVANQKSIPINSIELLNGVSEKHPFGCVNYVVWIIGSCQNCVDCLVSVGLWLFNLVQWCRGSIRMCVYFTLERSKWQLHTTANFMTHTDDLKNDIMPTYILYLWLELAAPFQVLVS